MSPVVPKEVPLGALASALAADDEGALRDELVTMFTRAHNDARRRLYEPLPPDEHDIASALAEGGRECAQTVEAVWKALHS